MTKRSIVVALVGLNLFLLSALILSAFPPPAAYAQRIGGSGNFIAVTCESDESYDVFYLVDLPERRLHAFIPSRSLNGKIEYVTSRDLKDDFKN